jgi:Helicase HerA, central domain
VSAPDPGRPERVASPEELRLMDELRALEALTLNPVRDIKDVWSRHDYHAAHMHPQATRTIRRSIREATESGTQNPLGIALRGEKGVGKTHLLGWAREQVQDAGGYFFLVSDPPEAGFWIELRRSLVEQLKPLPDRSRNQLETLLTDLVGKAGLDGAVRAAVTGRRAASPADVTAFIRALRGLTFMGPGHQDTARALVLLGSPDYDHQELGQNFLLGSEVDRSELSRWGIGPSPKEPKALIGELSGLLALSGPTVFAVDQIDALIDIFNREQKVSPAQRDALRTTISGLMALRDQTYRTLTVISCLPDTWDYMRENALAPALDRFTSVPLANIESAAVGREMIEKRFAAEFHRIGFEPQYPSWPIRPEAFDDATSYTPRTLLERVRSHIDTCLDQRLVLELDRLGGAPVDPYGRAPVSRQSPNLGDLTAFDARFRALREEADVSSAFSPDAEDEMMSDLLNAGLSAWIVEHGQPDADAFSLARLSHLNPSLHASLEMITDQRLESTRKWGFRAISHPHHARARTQLSKAMDASELRVRGAGRQLIVLRNPSWPDGKVTSNLVAEFKALGGIDRSVTAEDLKTFAALGQLLASPDQGLRDWLVERRHAHRSELFRRTLGDIGQDTSPQDSSPLDIPERSELVPGGCGPSQGQPSPDQDAPAAEQVPPKVGPSATRPTIYVGNALPGQAPVQVELRILRRHVSVFGAAGSGKSVLLRRIVESCALHGVSAIVLDPHNDLAALGDPWPSPPESWTEGDEQLAADYLASTDVVIWTPGRDRGRPLSFHPLPVFTDILDDPDEFRDAVNAAVEALAPRADAATNTARAAEKRAVLREALTYFGRSGDSDLAGFIEMLRDLPDEASTVPGAATIAAKLGNLLHVATVNDDQFAGAGERMDPDALLTPPSGKRARVSVISFVGLSTLEQQQTFVNQLQLALFSWIKKHPVADEQLRGLLVMDEAQLFAPPGKTTPCRESTLSLAAQGRKYGLGMLLATQQFSGLHNSVTNNCRTQFYGRLGSSAQLRTAQAVATMSGGSLPDVGRLKASEFYLATEGAGLRKFRTPMCLTQHSGALTPEEVLRRARPQ